MTTGICKAIYPVDTTGMLATPPLTAADPQSVSIYFAMNTDLTVLPQDQLDLLRDVERFNYILTRIFPPDTPEGERSFRRYYIQLFELARLGLVGDAAMPEIAKRALDSMTSELVESESGHIKNRHLRLLAITGLKLSIPFAAAYLLLRLVPRLQEALLSLSIERLTLANFMLIWMGCFLGVVLSYGIRTQKMALDDLVVTSGDHLAPAARHLFAGALTMVIGLMLMMDVFTLKIGELSTQNLATAPVVAFLVGVVSGVSELVLPSVVKKYSSGLAT